MLSTHFTKKVFIDALEHNTNLVVFFSTTVALMLTLIVQGAIKGNLKPEYFVYALIVSAAFYLWAVVDSKYRKSSH